MPLLDMNERKTTFKEVATGYDETLARAEAERCLNCKNAPCMQGCPVGVRIPVFIGKIKSGDVKGAKYKLSLDNNLASICGRVCPQENQCEKFCVRREKLGGSVAIGNLERYAADNGGDVPLERGADIGLKVAVVGSGPSALTCAVELLKAGASVTVYEALHELGGVLTYGIPEFRLPKSVVKREIDKLKSLGCHIETDVVIGKTLFIDDLMQDFDAVFIGSGAGLPSFLKIKGENLGGVYSANEYLTRVNLMKAPSVTPLLFGKKVVVVGAGNVAMDAARTALRMGSEVHLVYRRSRAEMPARAEEIVHAEQEGVIFDLLTNPVEILGDGKVEGMKLIKMELGEPDASGRRRPVEVKGSEYIMECDLVIVALGTSPNPIIKNSTPDLAVSEKGTVIADECGRTSLKGVYVGGDAQTGAATVILAMGAGKRAANAILHDFKKDN